MFTTQPWLSGGRGTESYSFNPSFSAPLSYLTEPGTVRSRGNIPLGLGDSVIQYASTVSSTILQGVSPMKLALGACLARNGISEGNHIHPFTISQRAQPICYRTWIQTQSCWIQTQNLSHWVIWKALSLTSSHSCLYLSTISRHTVCGAEISTYFITRKAKKAKIIRRH